MIDDGCSEKEYCYEIVNCSRIDWIVEDDITPSCPGADAGEITILNVTGGNPPFRYD